MPSTTFGSLTATEIFQDDDERHCRRRREGKPSHLSHTTWASNARSLTIKPWRTTYPDDSTKPRQVEHPRLREIFEYLNLAVHIKDAHVTAKTIQSLAIPQFERHRDAVQHALSRSPGQIHIALDGARARNRHALYGVTAFFRDEDNQLRKLVLGIPELVDRSHVSHSKSGDGIRVATGSPR